VGIQISTLLDLGMIPIFPIPPPLIAINTVDSATITPSWAVDRITNLWVDQGGVTLQFKTGEKIKSILITPAKWVQVQPLDGVLCKDGSCSGTAPTAVLINQGARPATGMVIVTITTNSRNIYKFRVRGGAPPKRTFAIGG
jgi:hypothetical protein